MTSCAEQWGHIHHENLCEEDAVLRSGARAYVDWIRLLPCNAAHIAKKKKHVAMYDQLTDHLRVMGKWKCGYGSVCSQCRQKRGKEEVQKKEMRLLGGLHGGPQGIAAKCQGGVELQRRGPLTSRRV